MHGLHLNGATHKVRKPQHFMTQCGLPRKASRQHWLTLTLPLSSTGAEFCCLHMRNPNSRHAKPSAVSEINMLRADSLWWGEDSKNLMAGTVLLAAARAKWLSHLLLHSQSVALTIL